MLELGPTAPTLHAALAVDIENSGIDLVFTAGPAMAALHEALSTGRRGAHAAEAADLVQPLINTLRPGDLVLVKGSHGSRMRDVLAGLAGLSATPRAAHA
jgi:UDP-N-acetylmuramoyl-tripeptide--D-alanyl-D-alanine ligase